MTESAVQSVEFSPAGSSTPDLCVYRVTRVPFFFRTVLWDPFTDRQNSVFPELQRGRDVPVSGRVESILVNVHQTDSQIGED